MLKLFFSYSHKDEEYRNLLETHLALLKRQDIIESWHDRRITAGSNIDDAISAELESSNIILLLVSPHFLASDYCYKKEMIKAIERHNNGSAVVIPVILHPCDWHSAPFGELRATPTDGKPISMYANQDEAFAIVVKDIREAIKKLPEDIKDDKTESSGSKDQLKSTPEIRSSNLRVKRKFDDHERDEFLEDSFEYIARYFDGSLKELEKRNSHIKTRFKRIDERCFTAVVYSGGEKAANCSIRYGSDALGTSGISYLNSEEPSTNSFNEIFNVTEDGYSLQLKPLGISMSGNENESLTQEGAAEFYWSLFIKALQE